MVHMVGRPEQVEGPLPRCGVEASSTERPSASGVIVIDVDEPDSSSKSPSDCKTAMLRTARKMWRQRTVRDVGLCGSFVRLGRRSDGTQDLTQMTLGVYVGLPHDYTYSVHVTWTDAGITMPRCVFYPGLFHPNIGSTTGSLCVRQGLWRPARPYTTENGGIIGYLVLLLRQILLEPSIDGQTVAMNLRAAALYQRDRSQYGQCARVARESRSPTQ